MGKSNEIQPLDSGAERVSFVDNVKVRSRPGLTMRRRVPDEFE